MKVSPPVEFKGEKCNLTPLFPNFIKLGRDLGSFPESIPKYLEEVCLYNCPRRQLLKYIIQKKFGIFFRILYVNLLRLTCSLVNC